MSGPSRIAEPLPLELAPLTPADLARAAVLGRMRQPFEIETQIGAVLLEPAAPEAAAGWAGSWSRIGLSCGERPAELFVPYDLVEATILGAYPDLDVEGIGAEDLALVLETVENDLLTRLGRASFLDIALREVTRADAPGPADFAFQASSPGGGTLPVLLSCHEVEQERLLRALAAVPTKRLPLRELTTTVAFRCGYALISLDEFATLEIGCGIYLDDTTLSFQKIAAVVAERFVQSCTWQTIKPVLDGPILRPVDPVTSSYTASGPVSDNNDSSAAPTSAVSDIPIHLMFELGRTEIALADLEALTTGYVFDLGKPLTQTVDIIANGRRVGTGELVRLGETIGVKVSRLVR